MDDVHVQQALNQLGMTIDELMDMHHEYGTDFSDHTHDDVELVVGDALPEGDGHDDHTHKVRRRTQDTVSTDMAPEMAGMTDDMADMTDTADADHDMTDTSVVFIDGHEHNLSIAMPVPSLTAPGWYWMPIAPPVGREGRSDASLCVTISVGYMVIIFMSGLGIISLLWGAVSGALRRWWTAARLKKSDKTGPRRAPPVVEVAPAPTSFKDEALNPTAPSIPFTRVRTLRVAQWIVASQFAIVMLMRVITRSLMGSRVTYVVTALTPSLIITGSPSYLIMGPETHQPMLPTTEAIGLGIISSFFIIPLTDPLWPDWGALILASAAISAGCVALGAARFVAEEEQLASDYAREAGAAAAPPIAVLDTNERLTVELAGSSSRRAMWVGSLCVAAVISQIIIISAVIFHRPQWMFADLAALITGKRSAENRRSQGQRARDAMVHDRRRQSQDATQLGTGRVRRLSLATPRLSLFNRNSIEPGGETSSGRSFVGTGNAVRMGPSQRMSYTGPRHVNHSTRTSMPKNVGTVNTSFNQFIDAQARISGSQPVAESMIAVAQEKAFLAAVDGSTNVAKREWSYTTAAGTARVVAGVAATSIAASSPEYQQAPVIPRSTRFDAWCNRVYRDALFVVISSDSKRRALMSHAFLIIATLALPIVSLNYSYRGVVGHVTNGTDSEMIVVMTVLSLAVLSAIKVLAEGQARTVASLFENSVTSDVVAALVSRAIAKDENPAQRRRVGGRGPSSTILRPKASWTKSARDLKACEGSSRGRFRFSSWLSRLTTLSSWTDSQRSVHSSGRGGSGRVENERDMMRSIRRLASPHGMASDGHGCDVSERGDRVPVWHAVIQAPAPALPYLTMSPLVSVIFSDIVGFSEMERQVEPDAMLAMLHSFFTKLDTILDRRAFKYQTIGDAYVVVTGFPVADTGHALTALRAAQTMHLVASTIEAPNPGKGKAGVSSAGGAGSAGGPGGPGGGGAARRPSATGPASGPGGPAAESRSDDSGDGNEQQMGPACAVPRGASSSSSDSGEDDDQIGPACSFNPGAGPAGLAVAAKPDDAMDAPNRPPRLRIGIHSGPVASSTLGIKRNTMIMIGDTFNVSSRMEKACRPGHIRMTSQTFSALPPDLHRHFNAETLTVKGKGLMDTYTVNAFAMPAV